MTTRHLHVVYVRPSRYDDDGYVVRYWRGVQPSNTLCCLEGLTRAVAESGELGPDLDVTIETYDDTVERISVKRLARLNRRTGTRVVVGFAGVQTNQFARASDLALELRDAGVSVMIGGFHVSGVLALFDAPSHEMQRLLDHGVTLVKGEAEAPGAMREILLDAANGGLKPIYDIREFPDLENAPVPRANKRLQGKFVTKNMATMDTSRGCPFNCSFCTIINVQGRKMRHRSAQCVLHAIEENYARGINIYFFTDDNFARNPVWEAIMDGMIAMRARGMDIIFMMQTDTLAHRIPGFVEKAGRAGCYLVFIGMESVNPKNLEAVGKHQNRTGDYVEMVDLWHACDVFVHVGYIVGMPFDTRDSVRIDTDTLCNQVRVDLASLFMLVPLPGSRDHRKMVQDRVPVDADPNNYDGLHETFRHPNMPPGEWRAAYDEAMQTIYSTESIVSSLLRASRTHFKDLFWMYIWYRYSTLEGLHPMATGLFRLKDRRSRRAAFPRENIAQYAWRRVKDAAHDFHRYAHLFFEFQEIWLLTRRPDDPRWATLADLRTRWSEVRQRVSESGLKGRYDEAAVEIRSMLASAADHMQQLSRNGASLGLFARRRLARTARDAEAYLRAFDMQPDWRRIAEAERFVAERILAGYEEAAIRYVAKRRKFNAYRREIEERLRSGRILTLNVSRLPYALLFELVLGCRFTFQMLR